MLDFLVKRYQILEVIKDLLDIVIRFRSQKYAFSEDITKMYCQVLFHSKDR